MRKETLNAMERILMVKVYCFAGTLLLKLHPSMYMIQQQQIVKQIFMQLKKQQDTYL